MARTRAEFGLRKSRERDRSLPPSGDRASSRAKATKPTPPEEPVPSPPEDPAGAARGAAGPGNNGGARYGPPPLKDALRDTSSCPLARNRASVSAHELETSSAGITSPSVGTTRAEAMRWVAKLSGGPRTPSTPMLASPIGTAEPEDRAHAGVFVGPASENPSGVESPARRSVRASGPWAAPGGAKAAGPGDVGDAHGDAGSPEPSVGPMVSIVAGPTVPGAVPIVVPTAGPSALSAGSMVPLIGASTDATARSIGSVASPMAPANG
jgi:hypothetical protein